MTEENAMFRFEKLDVWRKAIEFTDGIYIVTKAFLDHERYGLTSQLRRASVSVSSNIAEGSGRASDKDFSHFVEMAYGSLMEVVSQLHVAHRQGFLHEEERSGLHEKAEELARMLSGLRASLTRHSQPRSS
ncbi:MAG TPA: four helix bundle protein [Thermoguttaceae bacterium]|nr:four helix bundle protein [Thermoguttaceae bacterium]